MFRNRTQYLLFGLLLCGPMISSCVETLKIKTQDNKTVIVECILVEDTVQTMKLYYASGRGDVPVYNSIPDAVPMIQNKSGDTLAIFARDTGNLWKAVFSPQYGAAYNLRVEIPGYEDIQAQTVFPKDILLQKDDKRMEIDSSGRHKYLSYSFQLRQFSGLNNWGMRVYEREYNDECRMWIFPFVNSVFRIDALRSEYAISGHPGTDGFNLVPGVLADLDCFSSGSPITNYKTVIKWMMEYCPQLALHDGFVRINHPSHFSNGLDSAALAASYLASDRSFLVTGSYVESMGYPSGGCHLKCYFLSEEADSYMRDLYLKHYSSENLVERLYEYDDIYTNIKGGYGVFGAMILRGDWSFLRDTYYPDFSELGTWDWF